MLDRLAVKAGGLDDASLQYGEEADNKHPMSDEVGGASMTQPSPAQSAKAEQGMRTHLYAALAQTKHNRDEVGPSLRDAVHQSLVADSDVPLSSTASYLLQAQQCEHLNETVAQLQSLAVSAAPDAWIKARQVTITVATQVDKLMTAPVFPVRMQAAAKKALTALIAQHSKARLQPEVFNILMSRQTFAPDASGQRIDMSDVWAEQLSASRAPWAESFLALFAQAGGMRAPEIGAVLLPFLHNDAIALAVRQAFFRIALRELSAAVNESRQQRVLALLATHMLADPVAATGAQAARAELRALMASSLKNESVSPDGYITALKAYHALMQQGRENDAAYVLSTWDAVTRAPGRADIEQAEPT